MPRTFTTRPYSKVVRDLWGDDRFKALSPLRASGQALWLHLLTGPHVTVMPGLFPHLGIGVLSDRLGWSPGDVKRCWREIAGHGLAEADWTHGVIWLPNGFRHNEPANPNVVTAWRNVLLPQCDLVRRALMSLRQSLCLLELERRRRLDQERDRAGLFADDGGKGSGKGWGKGSGKGSGKGWVEAFDEVFAKGFPETLIAGTVEGFPEGLGESFPEPLRSTGTGTGTEERTPLSPRSRGGNPSPSLRRATAEERRLAQLQRELARGCPHVDDPCTSAEVCIGRLVYQRRLEQLSGMQHAAGESAPSEVAH